MAINDSALTPDIHEGLALALLLYLRSQITKKAFVSPKVLMNARGYSILRKSESFRGSEYFRICTRADLLKKGLVGYILLDEGNQVPIIVDRSIAPMDLFVKDDSSTESLYVLISEGSLLSLMLEESEEIAKSLPPCIEEAEAIDSETGVRVTMGMLDSLGKWLSNELRTLSLDPQVVRVNKNDAYLFLSYLQGAAKDVKYIPRKERDALNPLRIGDLIVDKVVIPVLHDETLAIGVFVKEQSGSIYRYETLPKTDTTPPYTPQDASSTPAKVTMQVGGTHGMVDLKTDFDTKVIPTRCYSADNGAMAKEIAISLAQTGNSGLRGEDRMDDAYNNMILEMNECDPSIRVSYELWQKMPLSQASKNLAIGSVDIPVDGGAIDTTPHGQIISRKYSEVLGNAHAMLPELEAWAMYLVFIVLESFIDYPNVRSGVKENLEANPTFFKDLRQSLEKALTVATRKSPLVQGTSPKYLREVAITIVTALEQWYEGPKKATKESLSEENIPIANRKDATLLDSYAEGDPEVEEELERRSKGRPFLVFKDKDCQEIDKKETLEFLKMARKVETPMSFLPERGGTPVQVLRIRDNNWKGRMREVCPIDGKSVLLKNSCPHCLVSFNGISVKDKELIACAVKELAKSPSTQESFKNRLIMELQKYHDGEWVIEDWIQRNFVPNISMIHQMLKVSGGMPQLVLLDLPMGMSPVDRMIPFFVRKGA